ncbi:fumarate reductase subunit FrdD [Nocardia pseudovaccinii]|uniref:fumarate reductase subunit FrdD n=1 Tax=Nocardia pseudovaccinii TaxID=189540 RepID=UPI0007A3EAC7|nr:fumarate reductase subunit FrdD [Nocardia pseudovaccinii]
MTKRKSLEPLGWLMFSAGGMAAALLMPVLLFLFGLAFPLGWLPAPDHAYLLSVLRHPLTRLVLFGLCVLALFHWAHRFRYMLYDGLRLKRFSALIIVACYGVAVIGSGTAAYLLLRV